MTNISLPESALKIIATLQKHGFETWAVGGSVRDTLLGKKTYGWDFTTSATPEQIQKLFPNSFYDNKYGTVGVSLKHLKEQFPDVFIEDENDIYEITTFRSEKGYSDKRHPDKVSWGQTLEEDLKRRDLTVNAIAMGLYITTHGRDLQDTFQVVDNKYVFVDFFGGQKDLKDKIIKAVGDANARFNEDALRMMRAIRFASELGFTIEPKTFSAIKNNAKLISSISWERIRDELLKILASPFPYEGVMFLHQTGLLKEILPELENCFGVDQKSPGRHHIYDVGTHSLLSLKNCPSKDPVVRLATLLHDIGKAKTCRVLPSGTITFYNHETAGARLVKEISERLRLSKEQKNKLWILVRWHQFTVDEHQTDSAIRRFIRRVGIDLIQDMVDLRIADRLGGGLQTATSWRLRLYQKRIIDVQKHTPSVKDLKVNGNDVMQVLQIKPGPKVGEVLEKLFQEITEEPAKNQRELLLKRITSFLPILPKAEKR
ncbi:MAG: CCA tRNA nucleotidyltransferase [Patescibacteria group bacterium]|nr:CCA tRNA nucleotidyltransferase [Patescibacteria group bacterium]